ncbi:hypothetical protein Q1695_012304 [Nippostrongylus brasiliensis]|nr:hypothetical protein Q1695_012304 [Nippostrongylus brasiliensis]
MTKLALLLAFSAACSASVLEFVALPKSLEIPAPSTVSEIRLSNLADINSNLLGLSARTTPGFEAQTDLFSRPRAIAVVRIDGIDSLNSKDHTTYKLENDRFEMSSLDEKLESSFGADRETVTVDKNGVTGSAIAQVVAQQKVNEADIKTKLPLLREELEQVYRLAAAISSQGAKFENSNAPDVYRVTITGLSGLQLNGDERATAVKDVEDAVNKLAAALATAYGDQAIVEVVALSDAVTPVEHEPTLVRRKRAADFTDSEKSLKEWRESLNIERFVSDDYPAIFAIFAGLIIALVLAVLYTVVGMMTMDPSKDSIIYRMTTTRMKRA